jgi:hypothetical protein
MSDFKPVDAYLSATYGVGLEDVLCDGCLIGRPDIRLAEAVKVLPRLIRAEKEDDGGEYRTYEGVLILDGIWYRFASHIFVDAGGSYFLADMTSFESVEWKVRLAV